MAKYFGRRRRYSQTSPVQTISRTENSPCRSTISTASVQGSIPSSITARRQTYLLSTKCIPTFPQLQPILHVLFIKYEPHSRAFFHASITVDSHRATYRGPARTLRSLVGEEDYVVGMPLAARGMHEWSYARAVGTNLRMPFLWQGLSGKYLG